MKIAFLGNEVKREEDIARFTEHWSFHLPREMVKLGCQYDIISLPARFDSLSENEKGKFLDDLDVSNYDHTIGLGLRLFSKTPRENTKNLRSRVKGCLGHIYDGGLLDSCPVDLTFTFRNDDHLYPPGTENNRFNRHLLKNKYIGWAASEKYLQPKQSKNTLSILVDHASFDRTQKDQTLTVLLNIKHLIDNPYLYAPFENISVRMIFDNKVDYVDFENISVEPYKRKPIPFFEIANEYAKAHIFMVTHTESVGLTMLENSLAGALVVTPVDLVPMDRLETIRHVLTNGSIDWQKVIKMVNPAESAKIAKNNSWQNVARRLYSHLVAFEKTNSY